VGVRERKVFSVLRSSSKQASKQAGKQTWVVYIFHGLVILKPIQPKICFLFGNNIQQQQQLWARERREGREHILLELTDIWIAIPFIAIREYSDAA